MIQKSQGSKNASEVLMKTKVFMIGPARSVNGGVSAVVNNYYEAGLDKQIDLTYLGTMEDGSKFHKLFVAARALLRYLFTVHRYDIIHVHMASDVSIYRKMPFIHIASALKKKIIIHQHGGNIREFYYEQCSDRQRKSIQKTLLKADHMLVIAPYLKDIFSDIIESNKITVMPNSIQIPPEKEKDYQAQKILFLGRLCKEKGIEELIDAAFSLKSDYPKLELYLGGIWVDENLREKALSCDNWIHSPGWIGGKEKQELLETCNLFVIPSYFEGQSVSLLEGMAYSCACIGSNVGGIPQMLLPNVNGTLIPAQNTKALKQAIQNYLEHPELQREHAMNARKKIAAEFDLDQNMQKLITIYHNTLTNQTGVSS